MGNVTTNKFHRLKFILVACLLILTTSSSYATVYYWVGGSGNWVTSSGTNHWALTSGGTPVSISVAPPTSLDDVIFDENSGFTNTDKTVTFLNSSVVRNITVSNCLFSPKFVFLNSSQFFDIYGNADFQLLMDFTDFLCTTRFFSTSTSLNKTINTNANDFYGKWKVDAGTNGASLATITINGNFRLRNSFEISSANNADKVVITGSPHFLITGFNPYPSVSKNLWVNKGEIYFDGGFDGISGGSTCQFLVGDNGKLFSKANGSVYGLHTSGITNLNYAGTNPTYNIYGVTAYNTAPPTATLDIQNTIVNIFSYWNYSSGLILNAAGSQINFKPTATEMITYNYNFGSVRIETAAPTFNVYGSIYGIPNITPSFENLVIERNTYFNQPSIPTSFKFTCNNLKVNPSIIVSMQYSNALIKVNNQCDITGTCEAPIKFNNTNFEFTPSSVILSDYILTEGISAIGPSTPYNAGVNSRVISGTSSGWLFNTAAGRNLIWVGPIPSNIADHTTYGRWDNSSNWRNATLFPTASPSNPIGTPECPPTFRDSVIIPNSSYIWADPSTGGTGIIYSSGVNFIGTNRIYASALTDWEIFAGLRFSAATTNSFLGTVRFRNDKTYECKIETRNVPFQAGVIMIPVNTAGNWRLTDGDLIALNSDTECDDNSTSAGNYSFRIYNGHFHTGLNTCSTIGSYKMNVYGILSTGGIMSWYGSDIQVTYNLNYNSGLLNCGISHLKLNPPLNTGLTADFGIQTYYKVSCLSPGGGGYTMTLRTTAVTAGVIDYLYIDPNFISTSSYFNLLGSTTIEPKIRTFKTESTDNIFGVSWTGTPTSYGRIDSLIILGNARFHQNLNIRSYVQFSPGKQYTFFPGTTPVLKMFLLGPTSAASYSTCVSMPTNYTGAMVNFNGSCSNFINIDNGEFVSTSPHPINTQYLNIKNNTLSGTTGFNANGVLTNTTGWNISVSPARKLKWVDVSGIANNVGNWNDANHWEQILPSYAAAPQCPPTKSDTILFTDASFSMPGQAFQVNTPLEVASMYWDNTSATSPRLLGSAKISIYGSIKLPNSNVANFMTGNTSDFDFLGIPTALFPTFTIQTNGNRFRSNLTFNPNSNNTRWDLIDSLALNSRFTLNRGKFYTNGNPMTAVTYLGAFYVTALNSTDLRTMDISNSRIWIQPVVGGGGSGAWVVSNLGPTTNTTITANGSIIHTSSITGGGYKYHDAKMRGNLSAIDGDEFDFVEFLNISSGSNGIFGGPNFKAKKVISYSPNFTLNSTRSIIDTMELYGGTNSMLSSNRFRDKFELAPGTTLVCGANQVQWFDNDCPVNLIGVSTGIIQMYSSSSNTPAYLRKDSASVCADYIYIKDIWGIGNGNNPSACTCFGNPVAPDGTNCPPVIANPWIVSTCDTIPDDASNCGPWTPAFPNRGRAAFTAGEFADPQTGIAGWDFRPYPPIPSIQLASGNPAICVGQSVTLSISGVGKIPFYMDYTDNFGNTYSVDITDASQLTSYNPTTNAFTYSTSISPTVNTTYSAGVISIERCFNNVSPIGTGSLSVTVNQFPQINNAILNSSACSGSPVTIIPSTSIPATVSWSSPTYVGISGHGLSGSGTISETLTNFNSTPVNVVYTLTPTANGCTGTPIDYTFTVNPLPTNTAGPTQTLDCNTSSVVVTANSSTPGVNYSWSGPSILSGGSTDAATVSAVGTYTCEVTNPTTGCIRSSSVLVNFAPDVTIPTITCPLNITTNTSSSTCNASVTVPNPVINDNCVVAHLRWSMTGATVASSPLTGINNIGTQSFNLGTTTVTYTVIDASNNQTTCSFIVTVTDNVNPIITCPGNIATTTSAVACSRSVSVPNPTISDNCTINRLTWSMSGATTGNSPATGINNIGTQTFNLGVTTVTYTLVDQAGNSSICNFTVTVTDATNPVINCPANVNVFTSTSSCSALVVTTNPTISDNCTIASLTWAITGATTGNSSATGINNLGTNTFNLGVSTVIYTITDGSGNQSTCSFTVTVTDNVNPVITCPAPISAFTSSGSCTASVLNPNPTVSDNCSLSTLTYTITGATTANSLAIGINNVGTQVFNLGVSIVTYTATDAVGNNSVCSYTVTITDNVLPTISCPSNISVNTSSSSCDASVNVPNVVFGDNCTVSSVSWVMSGATVGASPTTGINQIGTQVFNSGVTTIVYTVRDASNNQTTCSFTITVTDATPPVAPTLPDVTGQCAATVPVPVTTDNCTGFVNGTTSDPLTYSSQGTFTVNWTFTDAAGNTTLATQTVIIDNNLPPTPPVLATLVGECSVTVPVPSATTGCSGPVLGTTSDPLIYTTQGTYTITWTFDDGIGNVVTAPQTVIVDDITPPIVPVVSNITSECSATLMAPSTTDNCVGTVTGTTTDPTVYTSQGTYNVTWSFNDGNGNSSAVIQTVTIQDVTLPVLSGCPSTITQNNDPGQCDAVVSWAPPVATDNCVGFVLTSSHNPGDVFPLGTTTVTYTLTDVGGNSVSCSFDVTVNENEAPIINNCPSNINTGNSIGQCGAIVNWTLPTATDNCPGVVLTSTQNSGDFFNLGTTTVTYTATDANGNSATCTFDITVTDTENPVLLGCPSDVVTGNTIGVCEAAVSWTAPTASDNCPTTTLTSNFNPGDVFPVGTTLVTYIVTDGAGNTATCSFNVTVEDQEAPTINGLTDLSICEGGQATWTEIITDNCSGVTYTSNYTSGTVFPLGNTIVTYIATDAAGNTTTQSFTVNVFEQSSLQLEISPSTTICTGDPVTITVSNIVGVASYEWTLNGIVVGTDPTLDLTSSNPSMNGNYLLTITQAGGCLSYGNANLFIDYCDIKIPEALTPNSDLINDTWSIENLENYPNSSVQIVNRWGSIVFESNDYKNDWDGTSYNDLNVGGNQLPEGTFFYVLKLGGDPSSKLYGKVYTGYIYLKR